MEGPFKIPDTMERAGAAADSWKATSDELRATIIELKAAGLAAIAKFESTIAAVAAKFGL